MAQEALTPTKITTGPTPPSTPLSDTKVTLDNLSAWDEAFTEAKGEKVQTETEDEAAHADETKEDAKVDGREVVAGEEEEEVKDEVGTNDGESPEEAAKGKDETIDLKKSGRDLSKFEEADRPFLKQMSRQAFDHIAAKLLSQAETIKQKEAALAEIQTNLADGKTLPDAWYNDPAAAEATPEYKAAKTEFEKAKVETERLTNIMDQYESGQVKYNHATNTFIPNDDETPPDARVSRLLADARLQAFEAQKEHAGKGNAIAANFGRFYKAAEEKVTQSVNKLFPWMSDPKHENQAYAAQIHAEWPKPFRSHPVAKLASALAVEHIKLKTAYAELKKQLAAEKSLKTARRAAGPNPSRNGRSSGVEDKKLTLADFHA